LLYADFQIVPDYVVPLRLGSGRAGHFRGHYLKGIGRTPLAANWNEPDDRAHATGHLSAYSTVREVVVTWVLDAKGLGHRINRCESFMLAPLDPILRVHQQARGPSDRDEMELRAIGALALPCDQAIQGLTIKGSGFARLSNFVWLLANMDLFSSHDALVHFFFLFTHYLDPTRSLTLEEMSPDRIATELRDAIARTIDAFRDFFAAGVHWAVPQNNITLDGRFLDLDSQEFVGGPFVGLATSERSVTVPRLDPVNLYGMNVFVYLYQTRVFYKLMRARLALLPSLDNALSSAERDFLEALLEALDACFTPDHPMFEPRVAADIVLGWYAAHCDLGPSARGRVEGAVRAAASWRLARRAEGEVELPLEPVDEHLPFAKLLSSAVPPAYREEALFLKELLDGMNMVADRDVLFERLAEAQAKIAAFVRPVATASARGKTSA
jgi:hypothetical protein